MAFFNEFKEKFNKAAQSVSSKTKESVEITRLGSESRSVSTEITTLYEQIGRIYVDSKGTDHVTLAPLCARVEELKDKLEEIERQKMQLKNQNRCPACGAVMPKNARFCSACGRRMPEPAVEAEPAPSVENVAYCPECGAMLRDDDAFCSVCGHNPDAQEAACAESKPIVEAAPAAASAPDDDSAEAPTDFNAE